MDVEIEELARYLEERSGAPVEIQEVGRLGGEETGEGALKQFGFGKPLLVAYQVRDKSEKIVLHKIKRNPFGREREDDRVAAVWLDFRTFNRLPRHVPALDMVLHAEGEVRSIGAAEELLLVTGYRPGRTYADDLLRIRDQGEAEPLDFSRAEALAAYLAGIHDVKHSDPMLWRRRLRDLVGHGEGIMGLTESYPADLPYVTADELRALEEAANRWRWRFKSSSHRLGQVHGDFHPFNVIFEEGLKFHVLDRSRGEWGEAADDVSSMTINYIFFSLQRSGRLEGVFHKLHETFWETYLNSRPDEELMAVIQPWFAWRALVLASPTWYPDLAEKLRRQILGFARRVLAAERYDYRSVNRYLEEP